MPFVSYHPLKERLRAREVSDREALPYLIIYLVLTTLAIGFPLNGSTYNGFDWMSFVLSIFTVFGGVLYAYRENGGQYGYDLIQKYTVLGWVVTFRFLLVGIPTFLIAYSFAESLSLSTDETGLFDIVMLLVFEVLLYWRIGRHIGDTNKSKSEQADGGNQIQR